MKLKQGFILRSIAGRTVVLSDRDILQMDVMIGLNDTGKLLWELAEKGTTEEEMVLSLMDTYEVEKEVAQEDVQTFIANLIENNFLEE